MNKAHLLGIVMSLLTFLLFSIGDAARKQLSLLDYSPFFILFFSGLFISSSLFLLSLFRGRVRQDLCINMPLYTVLRTITFFLLAIAAITSFKYLPMTDAYILILTAPLIGILTFRIFFGEKIKAYKIWALSFGVLGAVLVIKPGFGAWNNAYLAALGVAVCFVMSNSFLKKVVNHESKLSIIFYPNLFGALISGLILFKTGFYPLSASFAFWLVIAAFSSLFAAYSMAVAIQSIEASEVGLYHYVQVFFGMVIGYVMFQEIPDFFAFAGAFLIFLSGVVIYRGSQQREALKTLASET